MNVSILNSRIGPNDRQIDAFKRLLPKFDASKDLFQHSADQSDVSINSILQMIGFKVATFPLDGAKHSITFNNVIVNTPLSLTKRYIAMIDSAELVIVLPQYMNESEDSPQWKTTRSAIIKSKRVIVITPAGYTYELMR